MRWALIGASDVSARRILPALRDAGQDVRRIYSSDLSRAKAYAAVNGITTATDELDATLDEGIDAVYVSSTNEKHAAHVIAAAEAGRHVLCEKPLATTVDDGVAMVAACRRYNVVLGVNHHLRSSTALQELSRLVQSGAVGRVLSGRVHNAILLSERLRTWRVSLSRAGGGVIFDLAVHDIDTLRFVLGSELVEVTALSACQGLGTDEVEDAAVSAQRYMGDIVVAVHEAYTVPFCRTAVDIHGSMGTLIASHVLRPDSQGQVWLANGDGTRAIAVPRSEGMYVRVIRNFCRAVAERSSPAATGLDGLMALAGALALRKSVVSGARVQVEHPRIAFEEPQ